MPVVPREIPAAAVVITPHYAAADPLRAPHVSLQHIARESLERAGVRVASETESRIFLKRAIHEVDRRLPGAGSASQIKPILETVLRTGIEPNELEQYGSKRVARFAKIVKWYSSELKARNLIDKTELLWQASLIEQPKRQLVVYGFFRARKEEIYFINAIAGDGSVYYLPCHDDPMFKANSSWAERMEMLGWTIDHESEAAVSSVGEKIATRFLEPTRDASGQVAATSFPNIEAEIRSVLGRIKSLVLSGVAPRSIALVCRNIEEYAPRVSLIAHEYGLPVDLRSNLPLSETRAGSFVHAVVETVRDGFEFEATARVLKHPLGLGISDQVWATALRTHCSGVEGWRSAGVDLSMLAHPGETTLRENVDWLFLVFEALELRKRSGWSARDTVAYDQFCESLREIVSLEGERTVDISEFSSVVEELLVSTRTPIDPSSAGVTVYEPNILIGGKFDHVFVMGLAEGIFPAHAQDNSVIDFHERKTLVKHGIEFEDATEVPRWESLSFYFVLLSGEKTIELSYPQCIENETKIASLFFERLGVEPVQEEHLIAASPQEMLRHYLRAAYSPNDQILDSARSRFSIESERESPNACGEYDGVISVPIDAALRTWSISQLSMLGSCGFKWFAAKLLNLQPLDEMELDLAASTRGKLYHKTLELAFARRPGQADVRTELLDVLEDAFAEAETDAEIGGVSALPNWELRRLEHLKILRRSIESPEFLFPEHEPIACEKEYGARWEGFKLQGRIDRIDRSPDGLIAIDYKTSSTLTPGAQNEDGKLKIDVQLPLYIGAALPAVYPEEKIASGHYYSLTKGKTIKSVGAEIPLELKEFAVRAKAMLETGSFAVRPDVDKNACTYCEYDIVCRNGQRISRKEK